MMVTAAPRRVFVPADLDVSDVSQLEPLYQSLLDRPVDTPEWGRMPRSYQVTPAGPLSPAGDTSRASHTATAGRNPRSQPTGRREA